MSLGAYLTDLAELPLDPRTTALLAVDLQNDFCKPGGFFDAAGHDVSTCEAGIEPTARVVEAARSLGLPVVWTKSVNPSPPPYRLPPLRFRAPRESDGFRDGVGGSDCFVPGTWGNAIVDELVPEPDELVIEKPRYDGFYATGLEDELRCRGVDTVAIGGVTTNCCVDTTARSAFIRGFEVIVLADCVAAFGNEWDLHEAALKNLALLFAVVASAEDVLAALSAAERPSGGRVSARRS